jgi:hypothetical protein
LRIWQRKDVVVVEDVLGKLNEELKRCVGE